MIEFRLVAMKQREVMEKTDKVVAKLESRINKQDSEMEIMKRVIRKLKTNVNEKGTILKQVLQENKKCVAELQSPKHSIEHIEKVVNSELAHDNDPRKAIIENSKNVKVSLNTKSVRSSGETNQASDKITSMKTGINVTTSELVGNDNRTILRKGISMSGLYEGGKQIRKQFRNGKGVLSKRDTVTEGVAFSAYLDHSIYQMGIGHHIICNQALLNDGNHYNTFTGTFTVPQTGVYLLTFNFGIEHINEVITVRLVVNNRPIVDAIVQVTGTHQRISSGNTAIIKLNHGESVWLENAVSNGEVISGYTYKWTTFSGLLLY